MPGKGSITIGDVVGAPGVLAGIVEGLCKVLEGGIASGSRTAMDGHLKSECGCRFPELLVSQA